MKNNKEYYYMRYGAPTFFTKSIASQVDNTPDNRLIVAIFNNAIFESKKVKEIEKDKTKVAFTDDAIQAMNFLTKENDLLEYYATHIGLDVEFIIRKAKEEIKETREYLKWKLSKKKQTLVN